MKEKFAFVGGVGGDEIFFVSEKLVHEISSERHIHHQLYSHARDYRKIVTFDLFAANEMVAVAIAGNLFTICEAATSDGDDVEVAAVANVDLHLSKDVEQSEGLAQGGLPEQRRVCRLELAPETIQSFQ